jgi:hypothetical protein
MSELDDMFRSIDEHFGRGPSYSRHDAEQILDGVVPEWLYRGRKLLRGTPDGARCEKAVDALKGLHAAVWPQVEFKR